jgi:hypothetical protein
VVPRRAGAGERHAGEEHPVRPHLARRGEALARARGALAPEEGEAHDAHDQEGEVGKRVPGVRHAEEGAGVGEQVIGLRLLERGRENTPAECGERKDEGHCGFHHGYSTTTDKFALR